MKYDILVLRVCDARGYTIDDVKGPALRDVATHRVVLLVDDESRAVVLKDNLGIVGKVHVIG